MFYNCYDKYGRYLGHTQTQSAANELIQRANTNATTEAYSAWLKAKVSRPNLSFSEFEYRNNIQSQLKEVKKQNEKSSAKWVIIILIITLLIFILAGGN